MNKIRLIVPGTTGRKGLTYMPIEYILDTALLQKQGARVFTVTVNGETILECLTEAELDDLTIGEIREMAREMSAVPGGTARATAD